MAEQVGDCDSEQQRYSDWDMTDGSGEEYGVKKITMLMKNVILYGTAAGRTG